MSAQTSAVTVAPALQAIAGEFAAYERTLGPIESIRGKEKALLKLIDAHRRALSKLGAKRAKAQDRADAANPMLRARFLRPIADAVLPYFPGGKVEIRGPFGLGGTACIAICAEDSDERVLGYLEFRYEHETGVLSYVDFAGDNGHYPSGSVGHANGLHHPVHPITPAMTLDALVDLFRIEPQQ